MSSARIPFGYYYRRTSILKVVSSASSFNFILKLKQNANRNNNNEETQNSYHSQESQLRLTELKVTLQKTKGIVANFGFNIKQT